MYNRQPTSHVKGFSGEACLGYSKIGSMFQEKVEFIGREKVVIAVECYPGVSEEEVLPELIARLKPALTIRVDDANLDVERIEQMLARDLTDDRVFGYMRPWSMEQFFDAEALASLRHQVDLVDRGLVLIYGTGATLVHHGDVLVYADLTRWEVNSVTGGSKLATGAQTYEDLIESTEGYCGVVIKSSHTIFEGVDVSTTPPGRVTQSGPLPVLVWRGE